MKPLSKHIITAFKELMDEFVKVTGRGYLGNCVASGTEIIEKFVMSMSLQARL